MTNSSSCLSESLHLLLMVSTWQFWLKFVLHLQQVLVRDTFQSVSRSMICTRRKGADCEDQEGLNTQHCPITSGIFLLDKALSLKNCLLCICYHLSLGNKQFIYQAVNMFISNVEFQLWMLMQDSLSVVDSSHSCRVLHCRRTFDFLRLITLCTLFSSLKASAYLSR